ncbi:acetylornithine aminotransferase apoenzyme [Magnetococcus marinus MC-1]|uniref:Acetylornithine aminotransferase n=1 Tax=Magnetococcus marinus (strain ATCC BAA-1437 / JCM 17883 / MC-1) TaxID=156889 RepID=A0LE36_MAGMM|nr:aspartate aminotransferase family protein [Magnetococcus marinus]ABK46229.1 acetylornithine aminotransferase apoenzyme [Magnetococcus marinus MC-1]
MSDKVSSIMSTYGRYPVAFERGEGVRLWDTNGRVYLDFLSGIGVNNLGHSHPTVVKAVQEQVAKLTHTCNLYRIPNQEALAARLVATCFADQVFFSNSGADANEAAIKLVRKYMKDRGQPGRYEIITATNSFHGRTMATLTATGQEKVQSGFEPLVPGFRYVPYNDMEAMEKAVGPYTAAIMVEPIQGESGVRVPDADYLNQLRALCDRKDILLVLDEVQSGMGRTGKMWAYQWSDIEPDIMTSAKALASGVPMGACLARRGVAAAFAPGSHGSTFGGNPLSAAAALATLDVMLAPDFLPTVQARGDYFMNALRQLAQGRRMVKQIRGRGLMVAMELNAPGEEVASIALSRGLLINCCMGTVLRFLPPLVVSEQEIDQGLAILGEVLSDLF